MTRQVDGVLGILSREVSPIPRHSSVPRCSEVDSARVIRTARSVLVVRFPSTDGTEIDSALRDLGPRVPVECIFLSSLEEVAAVDTALRSAVVGIRILIAGTEAEVYAVRARALTHGAIESEILLFPRAGERRVYCPHCTAISSFEGDVGSVVPCRGCEKQLVIYYHFSRLHAAYLGYMADAERVA